MEAQTVHGTPLENAVKLVGEAFLPGASLLLDGKFLSGGAHVLVGGLAYGLLGPLGLLLVKVNSYAAATTGRSVVKHLAQGGSQASEAASEASEKVSEVASDAKKHITKVANGKQ
jgi:hypothetical protein